MSCSVQRQWVSRLLHWSLHSIQRMSACVCTEHRTTVSNTGTWRTDRQTDGRTELLYQYRASVCWRAIKSEVFLDSHWELPSFKPWKGPKSEENDPPLPEGRLRTCLTTVWINLQKVSVSKITVDRQKIRESEHRMFLRYVKFRLADST